MKNNYLRGLPLHQTNNTPLYHGNVSAAKPLILIETELEEMILLNKQLDHKISTNATNFNDVLIYCKKTMEKQEEQLKQLDEAITQNEKMYEENMQKELEISKKKIEKLENNIELITNENSLMKTQLSSQNQVELEIIRMSQKIEKLQLELENKNEKIEKHELKEREIVIATTEKVRKELKIEFEEDIIKIKKELHIQNLAQIKANQQEFFKICLFY